MTVDKSDPLFIQNEMAGFDRKDREYYDRFTDEQRKKFSNYLMLKWGANVTGCAELQAYYILATNERVNKNFFDLNRHPKLQWLSCTTVSPGMGKQYHYWLKTKKSENKNNKAEKFLSKLYPNMKLDEIQLLAKMNDTRNIRDLAKKHGYDDRQIKTEL